MPNKRYLKGRRKEYGITERLKKEGWDIAQRSKGSHSPVDVIAIDIKNKKIKLIQSKAGILSSGKITKIYEDNKELNGKFDVSFDIEN